MTNEEIITEIMKSHVKLRERLGDKYVPAMMENITQMRSLIKHFITISSGIVGLTIPVFGRTDLIKNQTLLVGGLLELVVLIVFGYYYLTRILQKENTDLAASFKKYSGFIDRSITQGNAVLGDLGNPEKLDKYRETLAGVIDEINSVSSEDEGLKETDHALDIVFFAFTCAMFLITISMG